MRTSVKLFQSPRSGKFVSDLIPMKKDLWRKILFQSPRSGKFVSDIFTQLTSGRMTIMFQSPRSGKFVSDLKKLMLKIVLNFNRFNPLDRGNLYQIAQKTLVN